MDTIHLRQELHVSRKYYSMLYFIVTLSLHQFVSFFPSLLLPAGDLTSLTASLFHEHNIHWMDGLRGGVSFHFLSRYHDTTFFLSFLSFVFCLLRCVDGD